MSGEPGGDGGREGVNGMLQLGIGRMWLFFLDFGVCGYFAGWVKRFLEWREEGDGAGNGGSEGGGGRGDVAKGVMTGPLKWRWEVGFREKEVVVRRSRGGWDWRVGNVDSQGDGESKNGAGGTRQGSGERIRAAAVGAKGQSSRMGEEKDNMDGLQRKMIGEWLLADDNSSLKRKTKEQTKKMEEADEVWARLHKAVEPTWMRKTSYLLMDKDWDLDFGAMVWAHRLVDSTSHELKIGDFERPTVLAYSSAHGSWLAWQP